MDAMKILSSRKVLRPKIVNFELDRRACDKFDFLKDKFNRSRTQILSELVLQFLLDAEKQGLLDDYVEPDY